MSQRLRDFDPKGELIPAIGRIHAMIDAGLDRFGTAWVALDRVASADPDAADTLRAAVTHMHRAMFGQPQFPEWGEQLVAITRASAARGMQARDLILCVDRMSEIARELVTDAVQEPATLLALFPALPKLTLIQVQLVCETLAELARDGERQARAAAQTRLSGAIGGQIDSAAELGNRLKDQARDASRAARGMLDKASEVAAAAEQSAIAMREAAHTSSGLIRAIEDARSEVEDAAEVAARASRQAGDAVAMSATLSDHAQSIESILGLIRDIAGQTNLLALNATIEAARAGDAGRGFAVVAQEVKSLAHQTARATDDIAQKIGAIQSATRLSVETNERIRTTVEEVQALGLRIRSAMDAQSQTVTMITAAVDETALAAHSMSSNISAIRQDTEVVASEIDELEQGFTSVRARLDALRAETERYVRSAA